jgi:hypothetical protein
VTQEFGMFPFGRSNTTRPMREADGEAGVLVVGVYPSAWHVAWTAPAYLNRNQPYGHEENGERRQIGSVRALAVDLEPPGTHGHIDPKAPGANGSSGKKVKQLYLAPLRIGPAEAAFTDIYPTFVVKHPGGKQREQGNAIEEEYHAIARDAPVARVCACMVTRSWSSRAHELPKPVEGFQGWSCAGGPVRFASTR